MLDTEAENIPDFSGRPPLAQQGQGLDEALNASSIAGSCAVGRHRHPARLSATTIQMPAWHWSLIAYVEPNLRF